MRRTITFSELKRLSVCNSDDLPDPVEMGGQRRTWVGIGWVNEGDADGSEVLVTEDDGTVPEVKPPARRRRRRPSALPGIPAGEIARRLLHMAMAVHGERNKAVKVARAILRLAHPRLHEPEVVAAVAKALKEVLEASSADQTEGVTVLLRRFVTERDFEGKDRIVHHLERHERLVSEEQLRWIR